MPNLVRVLGLIRQILISSYCTSTLSGSTVVSEVFDYNLWLQGNQDTLPDFIMQMWEGAHKSPEGHRARQTAIINNLFVQKGGIFCNYMSCVSCRWCLVKTNPMSYSSLQCFDSRSLSLQIWPHRICLTGKWVVDAQKPFFVEEHKKLTKNFSHDKQIGKPLCVWEEGLAGGHQKLLAPFFLNARQVLKCHLCLVGFLR